MGSGNDGPSALRPETLQRLLRQLEEAGVDELEVSSGSFRIYVRREPSTRATTQQDEQAGARVAAPGVPISAPLTGIYYSRPTPEQPAFVMPGTVVQPGDVVALIETMKLFNEVTSDVAGEVVSVAVSDGDLVEAGQPLMYVDTAGGGT